MLDDKEVVKTFANIAVNYNNMCAFVSASITSSINNCQNIRLLFDILNKDRFTQKWLHTIFKKISESKDGISWEKYERISKQRYKI